MISFDFLNLAGYRRRRGTAPPYGALRATRRSVRSAISSLVISPPHTREEISAALDEIARAYFARDLRSKA